MIFNRPSILLLGFFLFAVSACQAPSSAPPAATSSPKAQDNDSRLTLNNATLEQSDEQGKLLWKIQVKKANYSKDQRVGKLEWIKGNLYQDGKVVLHITANTGEIYRDGEEIFLRGNIVATDPRNGAIIKSEEVEWQPKKDVLIARKNLRGDQEQVSAKALEGKYYTKQQKLELIGQVEATKREPKIQLKGERFSWQIPEKKISTDQPITVVRFKDQVITDQATARKGGVDFNANKITVQDNIEYRSIDPPVSISTNQLVWNYQDRLVTSEVPSQLFHRQELITITGNKSRVDLNNKMAYLQNGVRGVNDKTQAKLYSNQLTWNIADRLVEAQGNVVYEQVKPDKFNFSGDKAIGSLEENKLIVSGNNQQRVVSEIFPATPPTP